ncbi:MAG: Ig-like domain-containing protein [Phormidium tanganyikae FI6-MK23]|jgi:filamentous hemagglutinin family protein|nr:Ig-like domain-containing protein [Phormidium tanganyikae FI6-MK23]
MRRARKTVQSVLAFLILFSCLGTKVVQAQITPAIDGTGTKINRTPTQFDITGGTRSGINLFHSFDQFGLNPGQTANFLSNPSIQNILSRVTGGNPSVINGLIQVTGGNANLYLMNPSGIIFGAGARLNVSGAFTATTASGIGFGNNWFNAIGNPNYTQLVGKPSEFAFTSGGSLFNAGTLSAQSVTLLGGTVVNTGTIEAPGGNITIAAIPDQKLIRITQAGTLLSLDLPMQESIKAQPLPELLTGGNLSNATGVTVENGIVKIAATPIATQAGSAIVSGQVSVAGETPGKVQVLGDRINLINANIDASSTTGGGTVLVGGEAEGKGTTPRAISTTSDAQTRISADAIRQGAGGTVVLWSDDTTKVQSNISARGVDRGGFIETSGKQKLDVNDAIVNASTTKGDPGTWLLDPTDINIANTGGTITPSAIAASLDGGTNVSLTTAGAGVGVGDITLTNSVNQTGGGTASLTLTGRRLLRLGSAVFNLSTTGDLTFNLNQVNPEATVPTSAIQTAIGTIGTVPGNRIINLGAGTYTGGTLTLNNRLAIRGTGATTILDGGNARQVLNIGTAGNVTLDGVTIANGATTTNGAGIFNNGITTIQNSIVQNNVASSSGSDGGGIYNSNQLTISNSTVRNNTSGDDGGGIRNDKTLAIVNSTISSNTAQSASSSTSGGGAILNTIPATTTISNSTISGNSAKVGGAIRNDGSLTLTNSTVSANTGANGGGIVNTVNPLNPTQFGRTTLRNTIIAGNADASNNAPDVFAFVTGSFTDQGNNLIGIGDTFNSPFNAATLRGTAASPLNPRLAPLGNSGGTTQTYALLPGSSAINAGTSTGSPAQDQRGQARVGATDIGAFESQGFTISATGGTPQSTTVNTAFATPLTATVTANNAIEPVAGGIVTYTSPSTGASITPGTQTATINALGNASITPTATTTAGSYTVSATSLGATGTANFSLTNNPDNPFSIVATGGTPQSAVVNTNYSQALQVLVRDQFDNVIPGATVSFSVPGSGASGILTATTTTTNASGIAAVNLAANTIAGNFSTTGNVSGVATPATFALTNLADGPFSIAATSGSGQSAIVANPYNNPLVATVRDQYGNPVSNATVSFSVPGTGASGAVSGATATTDTNGNASVNITANTIAGDFNTTSSVSGVATPATFTLTNLADVPFSITATSGSGQSTTVNTNFANSLQAIVRDQYGNPVPNATVSFSVPGTGASGTITAATATTDASGSTSVNITANTIAGNFAASGQVGSVATPANFSLTNLADLPFTITATNGSGQSTTVNTNFANPLQTTVRDQYGNPVPNATVSFGVPGTGASGTPSAATVTTDTNGNAAVNITANTVSGNFNTTGSVGGVATPANFSLTNLADVPFSIAATSGSGQSITVNTNFANPLQTTVRDQYGNPVPNATVSFGVPGTGASGTSSAATVTTNASGNATINITANTVAGSFNSTGSVGGVATPATFSLTNLADLPFSITATNGSGQSAIVANAYSNPLIATVRDQYSNPVPNATVNFSVPGTGASGTLTTATTTTDTSGNATVNITANTVAGGFTTSSQVGGVATPASFSLTNLADLPFSITATSGSGQSTTVNTNFANPLQVTVRDQYNNRVPNATVSFNAPGIGASSVFSSTTATTDTSGNASVSITANTVSGGYNSVGSVGGVATPATFTLTNLADLPFSIAATSGSGQSATVNTNFANSLQTIVRDQYGNPVPNATVSFSVPGTGASGTLTAVTTTTDTSGNATVNITANTIAGTYSTTGSVTGVVTPATFSLTNTPDVVTRFDVAGFPSTTTAGNAGSFNITAFDQFNNLATNYTGTVGFSSSDANSTLPSAATLTNGTRSFNGIFRTAGTQSLTATDSNLSVSGSQTGITVNPAAPYFIGARGGSGQNTIVNTAFGSNLQATVYDIYNNVIPGVNVVFQVPGSEASGIFTGSSTLTTDAMGSVSIPIRANTIAGQFIAQAQVSAANSLSEIPASFFLTNNPDVPFSVNAIEGANQSTTVNTAFANSIQVQVRDQFGNAIPNAVVNFTAPTSGATTQIPGTVSVNANEDGIASLNVAANTIAGQYISSGSVSGVNTPANFNLTNTPDRPASIVPVGGNGQSTIVNTIFNQSLQALVRDQFGNVIPNATVQFGAPINGASGRLSNLNAITDASGIAQIDINANTIAGLFNTTASVEGASTAFNLSNLADVPAQAIAENTAQRIPVNRTFLRPLQVTILDQFGNPISNSSVTFSLPAQGASGRFENGTSNITVNTNANGVAQVRVTANDVQGSFTGTGSILNVMPAQFNLSNVSSFALADEVRFNQDLFGTVPSEPQVSPIDQTPLLCAVRDRVESLDSYQGVPACLDRVSTRR